MSRWKVTSFAAKFKPSVSFFKHLRPRSRARTHKTAQLDSTSSHRIRWPSRSGSLLSAVLLTLSVVVPAIPIFISSTAYAQGCPVSGAAIQGSSPEIGVCLTQGGNALNSASGYTVTVTRPGPPSSTFSTSFQPNQGQGGYGLFNTGTVPNIAPAPVPTSSTCQDSPLPGYTYSAIAKNGSSTYKSASVNICGIIATLHQAGQPINRIFIIQLPVSSKATKVSLGSITGCINYQDPNGKKHPFSGLSASITGPQGSQGSSSQTFNVNLDKNGCLNVKNLTTGTYTISAIYVPGTGQSVTYTKTFTVVANKKVDVGGTVTDSGTVGDTNGQDQSCGAGNFDWAVCPADTLFQTIVQLLLKIITGLLTINTNSVFGGGQTSTAYYKAWNTFRILGTVVIVVGGLIMVAAQALGFDFLDAYTIRKVLPSLLIAVIFMSLSWPLLQFIINFFNTLGLDIQGLMYAPFQGLPNHAQFVDGVVSWGFVGAIVLLFANGFGAVLLPIIGSGALALAVAVTILVVRQIAVTALVIVAPLAIACSVLPNTKKVTNLWNDNFWGLMFMFPLAMILISSGEIFGAVGKSGNSGQQIIGIVAFFVPYFLMSLAWRTATGLVKHIGGFVEKAGQGGHGIFGKARNNIMANRHKENMEGRGRAGSGAVGRVYRRLANPKEGLNVTRRGRGRFAANETKIANAVVAEALEADRGRSTGDDNATLLASEAGMTTRSFLREYVNRGYGTREQANFALGQLETGLGSRIGSDAMRVAAFKSRAASTTAYSGDAAGTQQRIDEGAALINAGLITALDATAAGKGNRGRVDISGNGFGNQMAAFTAAAQAQRAGGTGMTTVQAQQYLRQTLNGADPGDMLAGNTRTITALAPVMVEQLQTHIQQREAAGARGDLEDYDHWDLLVNRSLGQIAGVQDNLNRTSPEKAGMFADQVNGQSVQHRNYEDGNMENVTVRQLVEDAVNRTVDPHAPGGTRGIQTFLEVRKEYGKSSGRTQSEQNQPEAPPPGAIAAEAAEIARQAAEAEAHAGVGGPH